MDMVTLTDSTSDEVGSCNFCRFVTGSAPVPIIEVVFHTGGNPNHGMAIRCCEDHLSQMVGQLLGKHLGRKARKRGG